MQFGMTLQNYRWLFTIAGLLTTLWQAGPLTTSAAVVPTGRLSSAVMYRLGDFTGVDIINTFETAPKKKCIYETREPSIPGVHASTTGCIYTFE